MAMQSAGRRGSLVSDINVTPLADIMIVLLVTFMVTIPVVSQSVPLPRARESVALPKGPLTLTVAAGGAVIVGGQPLVLADLPALLARSGEVVLLAHEGASFADIERVLAVCRQSRVPEVALAVRDEARR